MTDSYFTPPVEEVSDGRTRLTGYVDEIAYTPVTWPHCKRCGNPLDTVVSRGFCEDCREEFWNKARSRGEEGVDERVQSYMKEWSDVDTRD